MADDELLTRIAAVTGKRPRTVLDHILKHGYITTEELRNVYGYDHPPRAARDVREEGIPLETFRVRGSNGRLIGAYRLKEGALGDSRKAGGRRQFPKAVKDELLVLGGERCALCGCRFPGRALQIDHRVPYEVAGEAAGQTSVYEYMLVCGSCNRSKSWSCESCANWQEQRDPEVCSACMWASPEEYTHIGLEQRRRLLLEWSGEETSLYARLKERAERDKMNLADLAKALLRSAIGRD